MSGHSKWATIKHKKGAADQKRAKVFAKLIRQVDQLYSRFISGYAEFAKGASPDEQTASLQKLASELDEFDKAFRSATTH